MPGKKWPGLTLWPACVLLMLELHSLHGMGMSIGGMYPHIAHEEALAIVYPTFVRFTWKSAIPQFSKLAKILNPDLNSLTDVHSAEMAAEEMDKFLKKIGLWISLKDKGMPESEMEALTKQYKVLPDYNGNPRIATEKEIFNLVEQSYNK